MREDEIQGESAVQMNYTKAIADIRAEIERLEREHGAAQAYVATFRLLNALELLAEANRRSIRLAHKAAWDKAAAMPTLTTISQAREMAPSDTEAGFRRDRAEDALRQRCFEVKP